MNNDDDYDFIFKVVLIGDSSVGKSNILSRYLHDKFAINTKTTVGVEFGWKKIEIDGMKIKAQIWDTAGQERYKSITSAYYKGARGALLVYDITKRESFENIDRWLSEFKKYSDPDFTVLLIGNKNDLKDERQIIPDDGQKKAADLKIAFLETSALNNNNIEKAFNLMVEQIYKKVSKNLEEEHGDHGSLSDAQNVFEIKGNAPTNTPNKKKGCC